jgi:hypothetical protein
VTDTDTRKVIFGPGRVRVSGSRVRGITPTPPPPVQPPGVGGGQGHGIGRGSGGGRGHGRGGGNGLAALALALGAVSATGGKVVPSQRVGLAWYTGAGAPANTLGALNEFYYDQAGTRNVYQKALSGASPGFRSAQGNTGASASISIAAPLPAGVTIGDLLIVAVSANQPSTSVAISTPTGWTLRDSTTNRFFSHGVSAIFTRIADGTEGATLTLTTPAQASTWDAVIAAFFSADFDQLATGALTSSTAIPGPSVTPSAAGDLILQILFGVTGAGGSIPTVTPPSGFTELIDSRPASSGASVEISNKLLVGGSGSPTGTFTTTLGTSEPWWATTLAIKPGTQAPNWTRVGSLSA